MKLGMIQIFLVLLSVFLLTSYSAASDEFETGDDSTWSATAPASTFSCDDLTDEELDMFRRILAVGASYTEPWVGQNPYPYWRVMGWYHGKIINQVWKNLQQCVDYAPWIWTFWYTEQYDPTTATFTLSADAFYHYLEGDPTPQQVRQRVSDYLDKIFDNVGPDVWFVGGNVPKALMLVAGYSGDRDEAMQIIQEEIDARPRAVMCDFNYFMENLMQGKVYYDGRKVRFFDVIRLDFLHATLFGHQLIADIMIAKMNEIWPNMKIETYGNLEILP
jgi:hypothetical protein